MAVKKVISKKAKAGVKNTPKAKPLSVKVNDVQTPKKGRGAMNGKSGRPFSKENQPTPQAKSEGKKAAKTIRELLSMPIRSGRMTKNYEQFLQECISVYGIPKDMINYRLFLDMRMVSIALKGDVHAYKALLDRAIGKPREEQAPMIETAQNDDEKTKFLLPGGIELEI